MFTLILLACHAKDPDGTSWEPPVFEGDGLPASQDTAHPREVADTGLTSTDSGDTGAAAPEIVLVDGLFAWYDYGSYGVFGLLALLTESSTCGDIYGGASTADGAYAYLYGDSSNLTEGWGGFWAPCGSPPCNEAYWILGGDFGYLDGAVEISSYDAHYLTVSWTSEVGVVDALTMYNCGDGFNWD